MKVFLSDYNPDWVNIFKKEKELLINSLGSKAVRIEHIGSTSVTGLGAKPVIDILLGVFKLSHAEEFIPIMQSLGYEYIIKYEDVAPERRYFVKKESSDNLRFHIHSYELDNEEYSRHLIFRDYLRAYDEVRDVYFKTKKELAEKEWNEANDYADAKTDFIRKVQKDAFRELTIKTEMAQSNAIFHFESKGAEEFRKLGGFQAERIGVASLFRYDIDPKIMYNRVLGLGLESPIDQITINRIKDFFRTSQNKHVLQIAPMAITDKTKHLLQRNGYEQIGNWFKFYRDTSPFENVRTDLEVKLIGKKHAQDFAELVTRNFGWPPETEPTVTVAIPLRNYSYHISFDNGKPVGAGCAYFDGDTAWFGMAVTEESHRRRGSQAAILKARIDEARKRGCKWISAETVEETGWPDSPSYRNMLRHGFRLLYKRPNYVFEP